MNNHTDGSGGAQPEPDRPDPGIGLVSAPARYPRMPILALVFIALIPAVGLIVLERWASTEADDYDRARDRLAAARNNDDASGPRETYLGLDDPIDPELLVDADGEPLDIVITGPDGELIDPTPIDGDGGAQDTSGSSGSSSSDADVATALLELRRAPSAIIDRRNAALLGDVLDLALPFYGEQSCVAVSVNGLPVADHNPELRVIPASTQKLIIAAVALEVLGPDFRYRTELYGPAPDAEGAVLGDVYLVGGGDPLLVTADFDLEIDTHPAFAITRLDPIAETLVAAGVTRIEGAIIGDGTRYDDEFFVNQWTEGVAGVDAGPYDALMVNDARGSRAAGPDDTPSLDGARQLQRLVTGAGIPVTGGIGDGIRRQSANAVLLGAVESLPLTRILDELLRTSDNNTAELLLKEIGVAASGQGTRAAGLIAVRDQLEQWGVDPSDIRIVDGSGLSPNNELTCGALLTVVQHLTGGRVERSVPVAGRTGALTEEFVGTSAEGRLRAKTGTLGNPPVGEGPLTVKGLAGWLPTPEGRTIEFVVLLNDDDVVENGRYGQLWAALADRLDGYPAGPTAEELGLGSDDDS